MNSRGSIIRRLALALARHAARVLPNARDAWAKAMGQEIHFIESDRDALSWAVGCVLASYLERIFAMNLLHTRAARIVLVFPVLFLAAREFLAPVLTLAYRLQGTVLAQMLGSVTPGDDYHRFIPLMNAIPFWLQGMWVISGVLFLASAWLLLRNNKAVFEIFILALALELTAMIFEHAVPAYREAFSFPSPNLRRDVLIPAANFTFPLVMAGVLWLMTRRTQPSS